MLAHFLAHKIVNFVLLTDSFTVSFFNIIEKFDPEWKYSKHQTALRARARKVSGIFKKRASGQQ